MSFRLFPVVIVWLGALLPAMADEPDPKELFQRSQEALKAIQAVSYDAEYTSEGVFASVLPSQKGHVLLARSNSRLLKMRADTWIALPDGRVIVTGEMISDGTTVGSIAHERKQYRELTGPGAGGEVLRWKGIVVEQLLRGPMYKIELSSKDVKYIGTETVDGIECHVVEAVNPEAPVVARWFIGKQDLFPRRVIRTMTGEFGEGRAELVLSSFNPKPVVTEQSFTLAAPQGYTERGTIVDIKSVRTPFEAKFLPIGSEAPDWALRTAAGQNVALKDLRGKVVLLGFWTSWAGPCTAAVPALQKLSEAYKDRPVAVYLINVMENRSEPAKALKAAGLEESLLVRGDEVARQYQAQGAPIFYVIGADGKVLFAEGGALHEDSVKEAIDKALQGAGTASRPAVSTAP